MDQELPNIRAEVRGPSPLSPDSVFKVVILTATGVTLATVQGAAHHFAQFAITRTDFCLSIGFTLQAIPKVA